MKNKLILHRGYKGKYPENSKVAFENAIKEGYSFETDIRNWNGEYYMCHDEINENTILKSLVTLKDFCELVQQNKKIDVLIFVHFKELKDVRAVISFFNKYDFKDKLRLFGCDEITEDLMNLIKKEYPTYSVGFHFGENSNLNEGHIRKSDFIWADEITKKNIIKELVELIHSLNKPIYAISPELIPESVFNKDIKKRWVELFEINIDGICTDKPREFLELLKKD
jgi:glycerophosphoryl diester phosphodiesterase